MEVWPVSIQMRGPIRDKSTPGKDHILVGQGCQPRLVVNTPPNSYVPPYTFSNTLWAITGATFVSWSVHMPGWGEDSHNSYTTLVELSNSDLQSASPHWYWHRGTEDGQTCSVGVDADLYLNDSSGQPSIPVGHISDSRSILVHTPKYSCEPSTLGKVLVWSGNGEAGQPWMQATGSINPRQAGIYWTGHMSGTTLPDGTVLAKSQIAGGTGVWNFTQVVNPGLYTLRTDRTRWDCTDNGLWGLDGSFPYGDEHLLGFNGSDSKLGWAEDDSDHSANDSPGISLPGDRTDSMNEFFKTYMLYRPDGPDVQWVSLHLIEWSVNASVTCPNPDGSWPDPFPGNPVGTVTASGVTYDVHPSWNKLTDTSFMQIKF